jgi:hypothetical protein
VVAKLSTGRAVGGLLAGRLTALPHTTLIPRGKTTALLALLAELVRLAQNRQVSVALNCYCGDACYAWGGPQTIHKGWVLALTELRNARRGEGEELYERHLAGLKAAALDTT